jgi:outer membrane protein OmpA-like peptidoglycan-associated protein
VRHGIRHGVLFVAALSVVSPGCATVEWTEEIFAKRQVEVDDHFARVETDVRRQGQRIDQVEVRVAKLDDRLTETRELVRGAGAPAPTVARSTPPGAAEPPTAPGRVPRAARTLVTVVHVPFGFDRADLDPAARAALAPILEEMRRNRGLTIDLEGSTDAVGSADYNLRLSQRRVETVRRYLLGHGIERARIVGSTARGPLADVAVKDDSKRRVMVKLMSSSE